MNAARLNKDQDKTYQGVMFHCGSAGHSYSFSKTLEVVIQKMTSDLKNPELVIKMMTDRKHIDFDAICPRMARTPRPAKER